MNSDSHTEFDNYSTTYDAALHQGISVSGESKEYFAEGRIKWLAKCLHELQKSARLVMDYGCGTGTATPYFFSALEVESLMGIDSSLQSLDEARRIHHSNKTQFLSFNDYSPNEQFDLVFCNGVFHHIPPQERLSAVDFIYQSLRPGGIFAFWENNPWNPGTRIVMRRIPFDRDAQTLSMIEARGLLRNSGFNILRTDFLFIFPNVLRAMRGLEPYLSRLPLGAQFQVLCQKPIRDKQER
jgi:SAM-dependent methyltransferase